jgi:predicted  nucleic acid-binding Zn-ribbon protein
MTKEELDRIKKAYSSRLKIQIWFNGYWEDFDIRDYSMYSDPFSENRQYRIVGSDYADIAEKRIADLEDKLANADYQLEGRDNEIRELKEQIEKMKCCGNCIHCYGGAYHNGYRCKDHARESICDNWEMMTDEVRKEMLEDD